MRPTLLLVSLLIFSTAFGQQTFKAHLTGRSEVMPTVTAAKGEIEAVLTGNTLVVTGEFSGLKGLFDATVAGGSHIHLGLAGQNGGIQIPLVATPDADLHGGNYLAVLNTFTLSTDQITALQERRMYVNIHTTLYAGGEIRGQLLPDSDDYYTVNFFGNNELPTNLTNGHGALVLEVHEDTLVVSGSFAELTGDFAANVAGGAHLHTGIAGQNGGISISLTSTINADLKSGTFEAADNKFVLTSQQRAALEARNMYANIHSSTNAGGEIRGQVLGRAQTVFRAHIAGSDESSVVTTTGRGLLVAEVIDDTLIVSGSFGNLGTEVNTAISGGAHLHTGIAGANGGISIPLDIDLDANNLGGKFQATSNRYVLTSEQKAALYDRRFYANVHSMNFAAGEIRGQLLPESQAVFTAFMSSNFELAGFSTRARGLVKAELTGNRLTVSGSYDNLTSLINLALAGGAHIHIGMAGTNGPIALPLVSTLDADSLGGAFMADLNTFTLTADQRAALMTRGCYVNLHTLTHAGGEIRGQLLPDAMTYFSSIISGAGESNPIRTGAKGLVMLEVNGQQVIGSGSFSGLESDFAANVAGGAHIHTGLAGTNGGIKIPIAATVDGSLRAGTFMAANNTFPITSGILDTLRQRLFYVNIHSASHAGGELRGQVLPLANSYFTASLAGLNEVQPTASSARGALKLELIGDKLTVTGSFAGLQGDFAANIGGGAHLHTGGPGGTGGISVPLNTTVSGDLKAGVYAAADNSFALTSDQLDALYSGNFYANIHSTTNNPGEIRSQVLQDLNRFPAADALIQTPVAGSTIAIEGLPTTEFAATWLPAADPDGNEVVYIWQLALDAEFNTILFQTNVGNAQTFITDFATVDALLAANGVSVGASVTLYHRVVVSDGCNQTPADGSDVTLMRGNLTGTRDLNLLQDIAVFPNPLTGDQQAQIRVNSNVGIDGLIRVWNASGQLVSAQSESIAPGENRFDLHIPADTPSGLLFVYIYDKAGKFLGGQQISKL